MIPGSHNCGPTGGGTGPPSLRHLSKQLFAYLWELLCIGRYIVGVLRHSAGVVLLLLMNCIEKVLHNINPQRLPLRTTTTINNTPEISTLSSTDIASLIEDEKSAVGLRVAQQIESTKQFKSFLFYLERYISYNIIFYPMN